MTTTVTKDSMGAPVVAEATPTVFDPAKARIEADALTKRFDELTAQMQAMVTSGNLDIKALAALGAEVTDIAKKRDRLERRISGGSVTSAESAAKREARDKALGMLRSFLSTSDEVAALFTAVPTMRHITIAPDKDKVGEYVLSTVGGIRTGGGGKGQSGIKRPRAEWTGKAIKGEPLSSQAVRVMFGQKYGATQPEGAMNVSEKAALLAKIVDGEKLVNRNAKAVATAS